ncbi:MAG: NtaA/DmoA family FMN-dependent monooxygenase, partial [Pseudoclavibacter sp.]
MSTPNKHMTLTVFMITAGYHYDSWMRPGSRADELGYLDLVVDMAKRAEAAKIDAIFFGDTVDAGKVPGMDPTVSGHYEPISTLSALAAVTKHLGLIGTMSTTFTEPYNCARQFSGLDSLSGGRAGWNIVTSGGGSQNFGMAEMPSPQDRYRRATEFVEVVTQLWDSWSDDAIVVDTERALWGDPDKIRELDYRGEFFDVKGPINMRRSPQGRPVMAQAGSSGEGMALGARFGDAIYTAQPDLRKSVEFRDMFHGKQRDIGRRPDQVKILPGLVPIIGETDAEAREIANDLAEHVNMTTGRITLQGRLGMDLSDLGDDDRIPAERFDFNSAVVSRSRLEIFYRLAIDERYTIRDLIVHNARTHGHGAFIGSAAKAAEHM